jgi:hypothetical protein
MPDMRALDRQVGGNHYKDCKIQPVEYITANRLGFLEGNVVKYITRHRTKGGRADIEKVIHYAELLLELEYPCQAATTSRTKRPIKSNPRSSKSGKPEIKPVTTSNAPERYTKGMVSTSTTDSLLQRVEATNRLIGG